MDAVFKLLVQKEAEIWTSLLHRFINYSLCNCPVSRDTRAGDGRHDRAIKKLCKFQLSSIILTPLKISSPVAAMAEPLETVVDRVIIRLDANRFSSSGLVCSRKNNCHVCIQGPQSAPCVHPGASVCTPYASGGPRLHNTRCM